MNSDAQPYLIVKCGNSNLADGISITCVGDVILIENIEYKN